MTIESLARGAAVMGRQLRVELVRRRLNGDLVKCRRNPPRAGDTIVVWKLDRLARSIKQLFETVDTLRLRNIGLRSLTESLDTTTPQGRLVFHMFAALAEFERSLIRERTQAGLRAARRAGRTGGRPAKLTDDDLDVATTLLVNPDITVAEIAERVGVSPATLYRYLPAARSATPQNSESVPKGKLRGVRMQILLRRS